ncbi:MAG: hypothetical protein KGI91_14680, partial [Burkholderiales bacterium]|nr:hypothetical protein [Burkholderiales bacterium]
KRVGAYVFLALSMLLMQQGGLRHALQHSLKDAAVPAHSTVCKDCLSYCTSDIITPQMALLHLADQLVSQRVALGQSQIATITEVDYLSRAPPPSSAWI